MKEQEWINWCWQDMFKGVGVMLTVYGGLLLAYWSFIG